MDVAFSATRVIEELESLLTGGDFEGGEELLAQAMAQAPKLEAFFHFQYGRLYARWNKLTSAANHLTQAIELSQLRGDELFTLQVLSELKSVRDRQVLQSP